MPGSLPLLASRMLETGDVWKLYGNLLEEVRPRYELLVIDEKHLDYPVAVEFQMKELHSLFLVLGEVLLVDGSLTAADFELRHPRRRRHFGRRDKP